MLIEMITGALDIKAKEKLNAEIADTNAEKIQDLQPKKSFQTLVLSNKRSSRVQDNLLPQHCGW